VVGHETVRRVGVVASVLPLLLLLLLDDKVVVVVRRPSRVFLWLWFAAKKEKAFKHVTVDAATRSHSSSVDDATLRLEQQ
jgi:hypothetical protein